MKRIKEIIKLSFWKYLLYGLIVVSALELIYGIIGFLLAIPTDFGRFFFIGASSFTLSLFGMTLLIFIPLKVLQFLESCKKAVSKIKNT